MAAQLDHADSDGLLRDRPCTALGCCVLSEEHTFSEEQKEMYVECRSGVNGRPRHGGTQWLESDLEQQASSWTTSRCVEVKQRGSTPRGGGVTHSEEEGEATSDALCEGGVSGDSSRTLRGTAAVKHRSEIDSRVFSNTETETARAWDPRTHEQTARDRDPRTLETKRT